MDGKGTLREFVKDVSEIKHTCQSRLNFGIKDDMISYLPKWPCRLFTSHISPVLGARQTIAESAKECQIFRHWCNNQINKC
jgi:hypothetical protein